MFQAKNITYAHKMKGRSRAFQLEEVSFCMEEGYFLALLGENGAGKSTLLSVLGGMVTPKTGQVLVDQWSSTEHLKQFRQQVAYVGEKSVFFSGMTVQENIEILRQCYKTFSMEIVWEVLKALEIPMEHMRKGIEQCSTGERKGMELAFALARKPRVLLLDEPTANLDSIARTEFMELLQKNIAQENMSVICATHILSDVEDIADYIMLLREGKVEAFGEKDVLLAQYEAEEVRTLIGGVENGAKSGRQTQR